MQAGKFVCSLAPPHIMNTVKRPISICFSKLIEAPDWRLIQAQHLLTNNTPDMQQHLHEYAAQPDFMVAIRIRLSMHPQGGYHPFSRGV
jgi:hypothetical protein